jgi:hypothetical protein
MKRLILLCAVTAILLAGCTTHYSKPGATQQDVNRDLYDCKVIAAQMYGPNSDIARAMEVYNCMREKYGYEVDHK